jgi:hypothetical protein
VSANLGLLESTSCRRYNIRERKSIMVHRFAYSRGLGVCCVLVLLVGFYVVQDMDRHVCELSPGTMLLHCIMVLTDFALDKQEVSPAVLGGTPCCCLLLKAPVYLHC